MKKILLITLILLAATFLLACSSENMAGEAKYNKLGNMQEKVFCEDSDGSDLFTKGKTNTKTETVYDYCTDEDIVREHVCIPEGINYFNKYCEFGCFDGRCLNETPTFECYDSDGPNTFNKGFVNSTNGTIYDYCTTNDIVREYVCTPDGVNFFHDNCGEPGCFDGACLNETTNVTEADFRVEIDDAIDLIYLNTSLQNVWGFHYDLSGNTSSFLVNGEFVKSIWAVYSCPNCSVQLWKETTQGEEPLNGNIFWLVSSEGNSKITVPPTVSLHSNATIYSTIKLPTNEIIELTAVYGNDFYGMFDDEEAEDLFFNGVAMGEEDEDIQTNFGVVIPEPEGQFSSGNEFEVENFLI